MVMGTFAGSAARTAARTILRSRARFSGNADPPAFARDLAHGTAEVRVDVIHAPFAHQAFDGAPDVVRVHSVELQAARAFVGAEIRDTQRLLKVALDQWTSGVIISET